MIFTTLFYKNNSHPILIFLKITFSLILIKEKEFILKKNIFWTILLKINFWDNFIYKTIFGQFLLKKKKILDNFIKNKFSNSIKNNFLEFSKSIFLNFY